MSQKTSTSLSFPTPKFQLGQPVAGKNNFCYVEGTIIGFYYTSRDAALSMGTAMGWTYIVESPAFTQLDCHHYFDETDLRLFSEASENIPGSSEKG